VQRLVQGALVKADGVRADHIVGAAPSGIQASGVAVLAAGADLDAMPVTLDAA
jgi:hypothetical protein